MGRQPMGSSGASTANAGAQAGRIGAQPAPAGPAPGARPALSQAVPAGGWAQTAPLRNTYRMGGGGMTMGSFMALPREVSRQLARDDNGRPLVIQNAALDVGASSAPAGAPATPAAGAPAAPTYKTRQEIGAIDGVVGTWTDENGVTHQTVRAKDGTVYADTAQGFRPLSAGDVTNNPAADVERTSQTDAPEENLLDLDVDQLVREALDAAARGDAAAASALQAKARAAAEAQGRGTSTANREDVQYATGESPEERAAAGGTASSSSGLTAGSPAGTPPPVQTDNRINAPAGGSNASLGGQSQQPTATPATGAAAAQPAPDEAQARQDYWRQNGRSAGLPNGWRGNGKGVTGKGPGGQSIFVTWEDIAAGRVPKAGEERDDLAWANLQGFAQRMVGETQTGPSAGDKLREDILAPLPETPRMSQEERQRQLQGIDLGLRQQAANRARAMMQGGGFANAESQAGVMAEMGLQNDANITQQRSARELAFALDDLSAQRQDHANRLAQIQQAIALSTNDYERQQLLAMQRQLMQSQSGIEATMAAYQRELSKPNLGESLSGLFGGAIGGLLTAPIGGIGMGMGSGLGKLIGEKVGGPDPYLEYLKSLRR